MSDWSDLSLHLLKAWLQGPLASGMPACLLYIGITYAGPAPPPPPELIARLPVLAVVAVGAAVGGGGVAVIPRSGDEGSRRAMHGAVHVLSHQHTTRSSRVNTGSWPTLASLQQKRQQAMLSSRISRSKTFSNNEYA